MTPRFKGKSNFDLSLPCPLCGYKIQPNELMRLASHIIQCPKCSGSFDEMAGPETNQHVLSAALSGRHTPGSRTLRRGPQGGGQAVKSVAPTTAWCHLFLRQQTWQ